MTLINRSKMLMFDVVKFHNRRNDLAEKHGEMPRNDRKTWIMLETWTNKDYLIVLQMVRDGAEEEKCFTAATMHLFWEIERKLVASLPQERIAKGAILSNKECWRFWMNGCETLNRIYYGKTKRPVGATPLELAS